MRELPASADIVVIGAGVIGCAVAWHLGCLLSPAQAGRVCVLDRGLVGHGTSVHSSGILRTHYSVPENVALAQASWPVFERFAEVLDDPEASAGLVRCGYLIVAPAGAKAAALAAALAAQRARGIEVIVLAIALRQGRFLLGGQHRRGVDGAEIGSHALMGGKIERDRQGIAHGSGFLPLATILALGLFEC
jgi:glycine/D-amino acid oxidase-like deaminating enzyme